MRIETSKSRFGFEISCEIFGYDQDDITIRLFLIFKNYWFSFGLPMFLVKYRRYLQKKMKIYNPNIVFGFKFTKEKIGFLLPIIHDYHEGLEKKRFFGFNFGKYFEYNFIKREEVNHNGFDIILPTYPIDGTLTYHNVQGVLEKYYYKNKFGKQKIVYKTDLCFQEPLVHEGKGTAAHNCGLDGIWALNFQIKEKDFNIPFLQGKIAESIYNRRSKTYD